MYVSQVPATIIYTVLKTLLLILLSFMIASICAWLKRYDYAKILEQGSFTILFGIINRKYINYSFLILWLIIIILLELVINFLPTIATTYMPFQSMFIPINDNLKYFQSNFITPIQNVDITNSNENMNAYCLAMGLCDINKQYYENIVNISESIKITQIPLTFSTKRYLDYDTKIFNFTNDYCNIIFEDTVYANSSYHEPFNKLVNNFNVYDKDLKLNVSIKVNETLSYLSSDISIPLIGIIEYKNNKIKNIDYKNQIYPFIYETRYKNYTTINNKVDIIYSDGQNHIILIMKLAIHSFSNENTKDYSTFNNSEWYHDLAYKYISNPYPQFYTTISTQYNDNNYWVHEYFRYSYEYKDNNYFIVDTTKVRSLFSVYLIQDYNFKNIDIDNYNYTTIIDRNITGLSQRNNDTDYINILNGFNNPPSKDLFMYAILFNSNKTLYGIQRKKDIVANISPIFIGTLCSIILLLISIYIIAKYKFNAIYFITLLEAIGLKKLKKEEMEEVELINKEISGLGNETLKL